KIGGDPVRKPDAIPTGNNFYSFDPRTIPTKEAWKVARKIVDDLIRSYYEKHGEFPEKIAYVLWATETMRNYGVMQAAVLYTIGVEPVWDKKGRVKDVRLIPLSDLKLTLSDGSVIQRPRIDVVVVSSGLHRDTFPHIMQLIDKAIKLVIEEGINGNESSEWNYSYKHYVDIKEKLLEKGYSEVEADDLAKLRIFAPSPGNYGTGLDDIIAVSYTWENEGKLAEYFLSRVGFAYGGDVWGIEASDLFRFNLEDVNIAVHSRSTNLYGILDNDDVFQYLGGIALTVRYLKGETPETFIFNLRNPNKPKVQTLSEFFMTELYTRYLNPKWIKGMLEHDYAGAREMMKLVEHLWGWEVTVPDLVSDKMWNRFYEIYVQDKYNLGLDKFFENNPYAKQSIIARMLEAIRKGYWKAPEKVKIELAKELKRLQELYGFTCCHHTCGNLKLMEFTEGILSLETEKIKEVKEEKVEEKRGYIGGGGGGYVIMPTPTPIVTATPEKKLANESDELGGVGLEKPKVESTEKQKPKEAEKVKGYKI
ncbi:MAG TPA: cobaltochelatase subunit CobN, partial [Thermotoga sp.]|nr:cobaltochelatase subunit CobN [Thermotoga sp.]